MTSSVPEAVLIAGPTASGKSQLAMDLARATGGTVINADALQVYRDLPILTARPSPRDEAEVPHALYGYLSADEPMSAGRYVQEARAVLDSCRTQGRLPIVCGGTGLYFKALLGLLDAMPKVPDAIRERWRARLETEGADVLHGVLGDVDPMSADRLDPRDGQRIVRALEVSEAAGLPLSQLQRGKGEPLVGENALKIVLAPERPVLRERIAVRFDAMLAAGAIEEVRAYRDMRPQQGRFVEKAIGFLELAAVLDRDMQREEACERAVTRSRQYAKRQETWFRHQFDGTWLRCGTVDEAREAAAMRLSGLSGGQPSNRLP